MATKSKSWKLGALSLASGAALAIAAGYFINVDNGRSIFDFWVDKTKTTASDLAQTVEPKADETAKSEIENSVTSKVENSPVSTDEVIEPAVVTKDKTALEDGRETESVKDEQITKEKEVDEKIALQPNDEAKQPSSEISIKENSADTLAERVSFDVLRVEKDGATLIAGKAPPDSSIEIIEGNNVLGRYLAGSTGDFVALLDEPLLKGQHELFIKAYPPNEQPIFSSQSSIIVIPESGGELLAMVSKPGDASEIVNLPKPTKRPTFEIVKADENSPNRETTVTSTLVKRGEYNVSIEAIDVEPKQFFVAGKSKPGSTVNIYINNKFKGWTKTGKQGSFLFSRNETIARGRSTVRADMISHGQTKVGSRASVLLEHEMDVLAERMPKQEKAQAVELKSTNDEPISKQITSTLPKVGSRENTPTNQTIAQSAKPDFQDETITIVADIMQSAPPVLKSGRSVIIRQGDNLWKVSRRLLGAGHRYTTIYTANEEQISNPDLIFPGQVLEIPKAANKSERG